MTAKEEKAKDMSVVVLQPNDITFVSEEAEKEYYELLKNDYPTEEISHQNLSIDSEPCKYCSNNPQNGGDGICFCILGTPTIY